MQKFNLILTVLKWVGFILAPLLVLLIVNSIYDLSAGACSLDHDYAKKKVEKYLQQKKMPLEYLVSKMTSNEKCSYSFMYEGAGEKIHFVVVDDFVRGPKLTKWDFNAQAK
ncbi:hypothetical protein QSV34_06485 [Porticoccus sp. W117]|uniref:hypothetical protein n=1 Tax=Porticoccus sp. W117 TaxID=3054777 RepID=UPI00259A13B0|nr:hypothetical protein [Porticoccus sp. W117]MDM3871000.1 hypothetical protein [Porticoccus sp. W117]